MEVIQFGWRFYQFNSREDIYRAQSLYILPISQDEFEEKMKLEGIEFYSYDPAFPNKVF